MNSPRPRSICIIANAVLNLVSRTGLFLAGCLAAGFAGGCSSPSTVIGDGPTYPAMAQSNVINVQVVRDVTKITFTNTTASPLGAGRLWVNQWYSYEFPGLAIGKSMTLDLADFADRYGTKFRSGGFFATEFADRLVQLQLEADDAVTGLVVIRPID